MMGSIMRETGMLTQMDAPPEAIPFIDAANIGEIISMDTARQLLMTYMRVRYVPETANRIPDAAESDNVSSADYPEEPSEG